MMTWNGRARNSVQLSKISVSMIPRGEWHMNKPTVDKILKGLEQSREAGAVIPNVTLLPWLPPREPGRSTATTVVLAKVLERRCNSTGGHCWIQELPDDRHGGSSPRRDRVSLAQNRVVTHHVPGTLRPTRSNWRHCRLQSGGDTCLLYTS